MVRLALLLVAAAVHDEPERYPLGATKAWEPGSNDFKKIDNAARLAKKNTPSGDLAWQLDDKTECYSGAEGLYSKVGAPRPRATRSRSRFPELFFTPARRTLAAHRLLRRRVPALWRALRRVLRRSVVLLHDPGLRDLQPSTPRQDRPPRVAQMRVDQVLRTLRAVLPH